MHPRLFSADFFVLYTFGVFLASAYLAALWWLMRGAKRANLRAESIAGLALWVIIGAILGAKLLMVLRFYRSYVANPSDLWSLATLQSAGDFYGGFIGAVIAALIYFKRHPELPAWQTADLSAPALALGQAIGRIGCFMAGDDYGRPTDLPWGVAFTHPDAADIGGAPLGIPLHPVQLYESVTCLVLFFVLVRMGRNKKFDGEIILAYSSLYALARYLLEFLRGDVDRGFVLGGLMSTSQGIAVVTLVICVGLFFKRKSIAGSGH